ncbi:MAG: sigma-70 family RNA polymerase sigma factor [Oscillospiraceae bacterium]|nr:sigma-70 family RNA polymerase sigma factor [Oscillospiraceae bacterium]
MEDNEIIALYMDRSEAAISETDRKYGKYCRYIAYGILRDNEEAEECVNDTYFRVWNAIPPHCPNCLRTFIGRITRGLALNKSEKLSAKKRKEGQTALALEELSECIPDMHNSENAAEDIVIKETLDRFLKDLPPESRKIFVRRYWYLSSIREIADEFGLKESKVSVTLFRLRKRLKTELEKEGIII